MVSSGWLAVLDVSCSSDGHGVPERAGEGPRREREREREGCGQKVPRAMGIARLAMNRPTCRKHGPAKLQLKLQLARTKRDGITVPRWPGFASTLIQL